MIKYLIAQTLFMIGANSGYVNKSFDYKMIVSFSLKQKYWKTKRSRTLAPC